uniref:Uncharacterized protein n=1 Tax=Rhizophora mucronata TaxID=61149 RepID=A0A2P2MJF8_RHIMU
MEHKHKVKLKFYFSKVFEQKLENKKQQLQSNSLAAIRSSEDAPQSLSAWPQGVKAP